MEPGESKKIEINSVFGETVVLTIPGQSIRVKANAVFGSVVLPDGNSVSFGTSHYGNPGQAASLEVEANAVFGSVRFVTQNPV